MTFEECHCDAIIGMNIQHEIINYNIGAIVHSAKSNFVEGIECKCYQRFSATRHIGENNWIKNTTEDSTHGMTINRLCTFWKMETIYQIIDVESILGPAAVYVDSAQYHEKNHICPGFSLTIYAIDAQSKWHLRFLDYENDNLKQQASLKRDENIEKGSIRYPYEG